MHAWNSLDIPNDLPWGAAALSFCNKDIRPRHVGALTYGHTAGSGGAGSGAAEIVEGGVNAGQQRAEVGTVAARRTESRRRGQPSPCTARHTDPARRPFGPVERECGVSRVRVPGLGSPPASSALGLRSSSFPRPLLAVSGGVAEAPHFRSPLHPWLPLIRTHWDPSLGPGQNVLRGPRWWFCPLTFGELPFAPASLPFPSSLPSS